MKGVVAEGVKEIWLSSEDTGAYGKFFWFQILICYISLIRFGHRSGSRC